MKRRFEEKGLTDTYAPKDVIRKAAQVGILDNAEDWLNYVDARNDSVHGYYGMTQSEYVELAEKFIKDVGKVFLFLLSSLFQYFNVIFVMGAASRPF